MRRLPTHWAGLGGALVSALAFASLTGCLDNMQGSRRVKELELEVGGLQQRLKRETETRDAAETKRAEVLKAKLQKLGDVEEVQRQLDEHAKRLAESARKLDEHITLLESRLMHHRANLKLINQVSANRASDVGKTFSALTLKNGKTLLQARIVGFGENSVDIRHPSGQAQVPYEELPDALRQRYAFPASEFEPLPMRPAVDVNAAVDFSTFLPRIETELIRDKKLSGLLVASNQALAKIADLRMNARKKEDEIARYSGVVPGTEINRRVAGEQPAAVMARLGEEVQREATLREAQGVQLKTKIAELEAQWTAAAEESRALEKQAFQLQDQYQRIEWQAQSANDARAVRKTAVDLHKDVAQQQSALLQTRRETKDKLATVQTRKAALEQQLASAEAERAKLEGKTMAPSQAPGRKSSQPPMDARTRMKNASSANGAMASINRELERQCRSQLERTVAVRSRLGELVREAKTTL